MAASKKRQRKPRSVRAWGVARRDGRLLQRPVMRVYATKKDAAWWTKATDLRVVRVTITIEDDA